MRSLLLITILLAVLQISSATAQTKEGADTVQQHRVMLIPFDPRYYLSDADRDLMEQSKMEPVRFKSEFRSKHFKRT